MSEYDGLDDKDAFGGLRLFTEERWGSSKRAYKNMDVKPWYVRGSYGDYVTEMQKLAERQKVELHT